MDTRLFSSQHVHPKGIYLKKISITLACLICLLGIILLSKGSYILLKAELAQVLMSSTWDKTQQSGSVHKPWPWADTKVLGKLRFLQHTQYVLEGESGRNLAFGPALMSMSAPLNETGNSVIVGHRDTHFTDIQDLKIGDLITLESVKGKTVYTVSEFAVINSTDTRVLANIDEAVLTLITCYPFNSVNANPTLRYVVRAVAVSPNTLNPKGNSAIRTFRA